MGSWWCSNLSAAHADAARTVRALRTTHLTVPARRTFPTFNDRKGLTMDFAYDDTTQRLREQITAFMDELVYPNEPLWHEQVSAQENRWSTPPLMEELKAEARHRGLWNLFLPATHEHGAGLTNLQYAPLCEVMGRNPWMAPEAFNCSAPDTGNMELLSLFGTDEQKSRWLQPLSRRRDSLRLLNDRAGRSVV